MASRKWVNRSGGRAACGRDGVACYCPPRLSNAEGVMRQATRSGIAARTALALAFCGAPVELALAQKSGGTLRVYNTTQPPSASIHEESDDRHQHAVHGDLQQSRALRSDQAAEQLRDDRAGYRGELELGRDRHQADVQDPDGRRHLARRQAVHGEGRAVHLAPAQRSREGLLPAQPARDLVRKPERGDDRQ